MKRVLCFFTITLFSLLSYGQGGQDFASRFMQQCKEDTAVHCITVSPHMMGQMLKTHSADQNENINQIISKLKSARIITTSHHSEDYYQNAEQMLDRNKYRFQKYKSYRNAHGYGCFYSRSKKDVIVELVMLQNDTKFDKLVIVNLTGKIDVEFITNLTKMWGVKTAKLR
jgi:hypothetical protein